MVFAASILLFARTIGFGWVFDDQMEVVLNAFIGSWANLPAIFSTTVWTGSGMETYLYRPLSQVTFLVNHSISGLEPWSYHAVNVLLHATISVMVLRLGRLAGLPLAAAGIGALLFAIHPVHVEVVAAVHGRKDLLATAFTLGVVLLHPRARREGGLRVLLATLALACAVLSKETGVMALGLVVLLDLHDFGSPRRLVGDPGARSLYAAYAGALLLLFLVRMRVVGTVGVPETAFWDNPLVGADALSRLATAIAVLGTGVASLVVPSGLSPDYSFNAIPLVTGPGDPRLLFTLAGIGGLAWAMMRRTGARPLLLFATGWYLLTLFPASNLVVLVGTIFGDRLLYLPSVAFCLAAGMLVHLARERVRSAATPVALVALAWGILLTLQTGRYSSAWTDDVALFEWAVAQQPNSTKAHHKLGEEYLRRGRIEEAIVELDRALVIAPGNVYAQQTRNQAIEIRDTRGR